MPRLKIAVYTMAKNEAAHVPQFVEATQGADVVVVTDTGSTDGTPDLLRDQGIEVHESRIVPWRFDTGTNCALCHVPDDVDICVKLDLDEVIVSLDGHEWRRELEQLWTNDVIQIGYWYTWSWHVRGEVPAVRFRTANIHARKGYIWQHAGHAALTATEKGTKAEAENVEIHHYMESKTRPNYLPLLQLAVWENRCPRTLFYLGREYYFRKANEECINTLLEYLDNPAAKWKAERSNAMRLIGVSYERMGDVDRALSFLMQAHAEYPNVRDMWWEMLRYFHDSGDFNGGYWAGMKCLALTERDQQWIAHTSDAWLDLPYVLTAKCCWHNGRKDEAVTLLKQGLELNPTSTSGKQFAVTIGLPLQ